MVYCRQGPKMEKLMIQPIDLILSYCERDLAFSGYIIGFDEYMDGAEGIHSKTKARKQLGQITLKGDNITFLQSVSN
ncbi:small nuclear ribonucleoprotein E-like [Lepus europaeus]|uniref:small nuclear ribonucleoprotein E-like n=1 Tax=Lepus europaeus TaxID=9983 RepID=UPI002B4862AD|nr:small nuclear ribonucleoprotein E-like [Lepus europaeus]